LGCAAAAIVLGLGTWLMRAKRTSQPLFTLTHQGITSPSFSRPLAWTDMNDYGVNSVEVNMLTTYTITIELPTDIDFALVNSNARRFSCKVVKDKTHKKLLVSFMGGVQGMKPEPFFTLFNNYYRTAWAKHALQDLKPVEAA
jgi:hypothetical protein